MSAQLKIQEKRKLKRFSVRLKVYSQKTDELVGYAKNLNINGMMIVTKEPLPTKQEIQLWFGAGKDEKRLKRIFVYAYKVWESYTDDDERFYYSGLHFVNPAAETLDKIQSLIYEIQED